VTCLLPDLLHIIEYMYKIVIFIVFLDAEANIWFPVMTKKFVLHSIQLYLTTFLQHAHSFFHLWVHIPHLPRFWGKRNFFRLILVHGKWDMCLFTECEQNCVSLYIIV
jgi:hypothetical protein